MRYGAKELRMQRTIYTGLALASVLVLAGCSGRPQGFDTLVDAGNTAPFGIWSDGTTMWVTNDGSDESYAGKIYAYDLTTTERDVHKDFNFDGTFLAAPPLRVGIWSDGTTMWVATYLTFSSRSGIEAYNLATKRNDESKDFGTLTDAGNIYATGIWSDGTTMWVADYYDEKIYAYDLATKARDASKDFDTLVAAGNSYPTGIWSDGTTMWIADLDTAKIYAYDLATKVRDAGKDFDTLIDAGNTWPTGIWSDGTTMWVANSDRDNEYNVKIYAYNLATKRPIP